eukprot:14727583-Alexandrium_andersonii.AAC.1
MARKAGASSGDAPLPLRSVAQAGALLAPSAVPCEVWQQGPSPRERSPRRRRRLRRRAATPP